MSGLITEQHGEILDFFFLDVSDYTPEELYDPKDDFNINESEFRQRAEKTLSALISLK